MGDVLSQSEVESLLAALDPGLQPQHTVTNTRRDDFRSQISVYDFKRPERVSKEQMRAFQALHEGFSREFGAGLSGMLRAIIEVKLISVDQLTYSEFVFSLENPTCFNLLASEGLEGHIILDLNPSIIFPIIDRLLGGGKEAANDFPGRPLTEIELQLVSRITGLAIVGLENAWANIAKLGLRVQQVESNPQLVQIVPPNEVIVLISFEVSMGEVRGIMNLCIPFNAIEPLAGKLSSDSWSAYTKKAADPRQVLNLETSVQSAAVEVVVNLARGKLTAGELSGLAVGDVIMTETEHQDGAEVLVEGTPLFRALPGVLKGHKAITMGQTLTKPRDMIAKKLAEMGIASPPPGKAELPQERRRTG
ncbi:MAG TPA: flagellar motor switch protein FliM [Planctomycetaceae bacterium]|nr:flagellar motor switch protein FliM [Planctomycetaceae bacterium]